MGSAYAALLPDVELRARTRAYAATVLSPQRASLHSLYSSPRAAVFGFDVKFDHFEDCPKFVGRWKSRWPAYAALKVEAGDAGLSLV